jgi:hypothetical protein
MQVPTWTKPALWGAAVGAVGLAIIGFSAGWVVSSDTAMDMATQRSQQAVIASLTPICIAQYQSTSGDATLLASLEGKSSWTRGDFVEEQGWATMPGSQTPNSQVADACAIELLKLTKG